MKVVAKAADFNFIAPQRHTHIVTFDLGAQNCLLKEILG